MLKGVRVQVPPSVFLFFLFYFGLDKPEQAGDGPIEDDKDREYEDPCRISPFKETVPVVGAGFGRYTVYQAVYKICKAVQKSGDHRV